MSKRLRIAQIAPVATPVSASSTGSIEQLVWLLTEELVRRGHEVTLFAAGNSETRADLRAVYPRGYEQDDDLWNWEFHEALNVAAAFEQAGDFDIIHCHVYQYALPFIRLVKTPVVHSYHILPDDDIIRAYARYPDAHIVAISRFQRSVFEANADVAVVHHGINIKAFPFNPKPGDYLLFLGRLIADKGVVEAIHAAKKAARRLLIAGPRDDEDEGYFESQVAPLLDGRQIEYVGPVGLRERNRLLAGAGALIYPLVAPEPFGLVLVEALACGTPVVATELGAVPELVEHGVTGYCAQDPQALATRIPDALALDRSRIRREAEVLFDYQRMVDEYELIYQRLTAFRRVRCRQ